MKLKPIVESIITEGKSTPLIVVDVQPAYDSYCDSIKYELAEFVNRQTGNIMIFFNGEDLGLDSKSSVIEYWIENGLDEEKVDSILWTEKMYGFFRDWMDEGVPDSIIKKTIREMIVNRNYDYRDLDQEWLTNILTPDYEHLVDSPISIPDISISNLRKFRNGYICGGGQHECLKEITLFMNALNFNYTVLKRFVY